MNRAKPVLMPLGLAFLIAGFVVFQMWPGRAIIQIGLLATGGLLFAFGLFWQRAELIDLLRTRSVRSGAAAFLYSLVILSIWILANWLAIRHSVRFDLTEEKIYTLDPRTVEELKRLDQPIAILAFIGSADEGARVRIRDLMEEFRHHTDQIDYEFIDPFKNPGQVEAFDIAAEGTLVFQSGGRTVKEIGFDEEKITNAIRKVRTVTRRVIYFTRGHGERAIDDFEGHGISQLRDALDTLQFEVKTIHLLQESGIPADAAVVAVIGPEAAFLEAEAGWVGDWVASGGSLLVLAEPGQPHGLDAVLAGYGLRIHDDRVINLNPISRLMGFDHNVPLGMEYTAHPIVEEMTVTTIFPVAASVELIDEGVDPLVEKEILVRTDEQSWAETSLEEIQAGILQPNPGVDRLGPVPLGGAATAPVQAAVEEIGDEIAAAGDAEPESETADLGDPAAMDDDRGRSRVVVFGDSSHASNQFINMQGNRDLVLNTFEWLAEGDDSISIPPRRPKSRTLTLNRGQAQLVKYSTLVGLPLTFLVLGIGVWWRRKNL